MKMISSLYRMRYAGGPTWRNIFTDSQSRDGFSERRSWIVRGRRRSPGCLKSCPWRAKERLSRLRESRRTKAWFLAWLSLSGGLRRTMSTKRRLVSRSRTSIVASSAGRIAGGQRRPAERQFFEKGEKPALGFGEQGAVPGTGNRQALDLLRLHCGKQGNRPFHRRQLARQRVLANTVVVADGEEPPIRLQLLAHLLHRRQRTAPSTARRCTRPVLWGECPARATDRATGCWRAR